MGVGDGGGGRGREGNIQVSCGALWTHPSSAPQCKTQSISVHPSAHPTSSCHILTLSASHQPLPPPPPIPPHFSPSHLEVWGVAHEGVTEGVLQRLQAVIPAGDAIQACHETVLHGGGGERRLITEMSHVM